MTINLTSIKRSDLPVDILNTFDSTTAVFCLILSLGVLVWLN